MSRVLKAKFQLGLFESPYVPEEKIQQLAKDQTHKTIAKEAARESIVLLKNKNNILPLNKNIHTIGVIGEDATAARPLADRVAGTEAQQVATPGHPRELSPLGRDLSR